MSYPRNDEPISERWRLAAKRWNQLNEAATLLEELKTAHLAKRKAALGDIPDNRAERIVKASDEWEGYVTKMCRARAAAEDAKVDAKFLEMQHREWISADANARAERKM